ncbi:pteridine reductase [Gammaproteobacteria bacterium]
MITNANASHSVALVTGAARRIGATLAMGLHASGMRVALHYRHAQTEASALQTRMETQRPGSTALFRADLTDQAALSTLVAAVVERFGRLDLLVHNASSFYPTPLGETRLEHWEDLMATNLRSPFFLTQAALPALREARGSVVHLLDIHARRPLRGYSVYCAAKAGAVMLVKALAQELGPEVRVNGISPGAILWPETPASEAKQQMILERTALHRAGTPEDIWLALRFLVFDAPYMTGQVLTLDGGRTLHQ